MSSSGSERADWELAEGPVVGQDVPITSEPREEEAPGVPVAPEVHQPDGADDDSDEGLTEEHDAPADDPESGSTVRDHDGSTVGDDD
ncbi:MAG: hypothetical protein WCB67_13430 [Solirubrobacteraceae bacterium]